MPSKEPSLPARILTDPAYHDVIKLVGYRGIQTPISEADYKRLVEKYGRERLGSVSEAVVDINAETKLAMLKAEVRKHCTAILGPSPEEWDSFYEGIENPPLNPYLAPEAKKATPKTHRKRRAAKKPTIDQVATAVADAIREETGMDVETRSPDEKKPIADESPIATPPSAPPQNALASFELHVLQDQLQNARMRCLCSKTQKARDRAYREVQRLLAEYERRKVAAPAPTPEVQARTMVVAPIGFADVTQATDRRLRELLDMNLKELETNDLDTICYQEALRDIKLIEAEVRRRDAAV